ncbi:MAG: hypothetical protein DMG39_24185 [Acidobacteria bacterium]|nr:MAG: hypothetical protein DMG39_24185 [Acidobacteriota bacterium]
MNHFPSLRIHNCEKFVAASDKKPVVLEVHIHGGGFFRGGDGPTGLDGVGAGVESDYLILVFNVAVNGPVAVGDGIFGAAAHIHRGHHGVVRRVNDGGIVGLTVHRKDVF